MKFRSEELLLTMRKEPQDNTLLAMYKSLQSLLSARNSPPLSHGGDLRFRKILNTPQRRSVSGVLSSSFQAKPSPCFRRQQAANFVSETLPKLQSSPFDTKNPSRTPKKRKKRVFIPRKAAVELTDKARQFFKLLLENPPRPDIIGIMLNYDQSKTGEPRMVFSFDFVSANDITADDEGVSLEVLPDASPKPPSESLNDGLPKLYVSHNAFLKVLGATVDVDTKDVKPILYDKEGNLMDPNA